MVAASRTGVVKRVEQVNLTTSHQSHMKQDSGGVENEMSCKARGYRGKAIWGASTDLKGTELTRGVCTMHANHNDRR